MTEATKNRPTTNLLDKFEVDYLLTKLEADRLAFIMAHCPVTPQLPIDESLAEKGWARIDPNDDCTWPTTTALQSFYKDDGAVRRSNLEGQGLSADIIRRLIGTCTGTCSWCNKEESYFCRASRWGGDYCANPECRYSELRARIDAAANHRPRKGAS